MPEIAEVERARLRIHRQLLNHTVGKVETTADELVFKDIDHKVFASTILNKTIVDTKRWGKYFIIIFDKEPHIVAHLGMTGGIRFKHEEEVWPPKFTKLHVEFKSPKGNTICFAFKDPRRISRLRLVHGDPFLQEPINRLGFDPVLGMPTLEAFSKLVTKRTVTIKSLLLDQSFSAGIGNWVADEVLYQSCIHPAQNTKSLTDKEVQTLYEKIIFVCKLAVSVEGNENKFPLDWLMRYRWNKGKSTGKGVLPNGLQLKFETVAGRTSAFAPERQKLRPFKVKTVTKTVKKKVVVKNKDETEWEKQEQIVKRKRSAKKDLDTDEAIEANSSLKTIAMRPAKKVKKEEQVERTPSSRYSFRKIKATAK